MIILKPRFSNYFAMAVMGLFWLVTGLFSWSRSGPLDFRTPFFLILGLVLLFRATHVLMNLKSRHIYIDDQGLVIAKDGVTETIPWVTIQKIYYARKWFRNSIFIVQHDSKVTSINCWPYGKVQNVLAAILKHHPGNVK